MLKHLKTLKPYIKLWSTKVKINGVWIPAVIYMCLYYNKDGIIWVMTKEDFENNFK